MSEKDKIRKRALAAIDKMDEDEAKRANNDKDYMHDWLQEVIGWIVNLMAIIIGLF